jgi:hypothetical protein
VKRLPLLLAALLALSALPACSQARWESVETEHFLFVFEPRDKASVEELLGVCEDVYARVTGFFHSYPPKVRCVIRGRLDYANGEMAPFPERLELILTSPSDDTFGGREQGWLALLLTHELTHDVHLTLDRGAFFAVSRVFGRDAALASSVLLPGWMIEGTAVDLETRLTTGGRGRSAFFEDYWKAPVLEGAPFSIEQAGYSSSFPPLGRIWLAGYFIVDYILRTYGQDALARIMDDYLAFPFFGPWAAIGRVTGKGAAEVYQDLLRESRDRYTEASFVSGGALVTPDRIADYTAPHATARGLYVYRTDLENFPSLVRLDTRSGTETTLAQVRLTDPYSFSATADGAVVWLSSLSFDWTPPDGEWAISDLWVLDARTGRLEQVTRGARVWQPAVSADGATVVAVQGRGQYSRLVAVDHGTGGLRVLYERAGGRVSSPDVSPDGALAAFTLTLGGRQDVYVLDLRKALAAPAAETGSPEVNPELAVPVLAPGRGIESRPRFSGDRRLFFSTDGTGSLCLYAADLDSGEVRLIQRDPVAAYEGIEQEGSLIYASYSHKGYCLKTVPRLPEGEPLAADVPEPAPQPAASAPAAVPAAAADGRFDADPAAPEAFDAGPAAKPYFDLPLPVLWYPSAAIAVTGPSTYEIGVGLGAFGRSLLGMSSWSADALWLPSSGQPAAGFTASMPIANASASYSLSLGYSYFDGSPGAYAQTLANNLDIAVPLFSWTRLASASALWVSAGAGHEASLAALSPFTASGSLSAPASAWQQYLHLRAGVSWRLLAGGGQIDFYHPWDVGLSLGSLVDPPVLSSPGWGSLLSALASLSVPSLVPHQVLKLGIKASYGLGALSTFWDAAVAPRGFPGLSHPGAPGGLVSSLDYLAPIALLDQPLLFGLALLGLGAGLHAEHVSGWGAAPAAFLPGTAFYAGAELTLVLGYAGQSLPVGIGVAARIDAAAPASFDAARDLRPYLFLSFDSFRDWAGAAPAPAAAYAGRAAGLSH